MLRETTPDQPFKTIGEETQTPSGFDFDPCSNGSRFEKTNKNHEAKDSRTLRSTRRPF